MPVLLGHLARAPARIYGRGRWGWAGADPKGGTSMVRKALFTLLLVAILVPAAQAGNGNGKAKPLDLAQAQALASAPGASLGTTIGPASPLDALAAASQP